MPRTSLLRTSCLSSRASRWISMATKPDGIRLMRHFGFTEAEPKAPGFRDFFIEVAVSGIPFIVEYKAAPHAWQERQHDNTAVGVACLVNLLDILDPASLAPDVPLLPDELPTVLARNKSLPQQE